MSLEQTISDYLLRKSFLKEDLSVSRACAKALVELSDAFTRGRAKLPKQYFADELHRDAYVAGFVLTNAAKVEHCLVHHLDLLPEGKPISILDIGSGPGTAILAASEFLAKHRPDQEVRFVGVEANRDIVTAAKELAEAVLPKYHTVEWHVGDVEKVVSGFVDMHFDLTIAANVLNESPAAATICRRALEKSDSLIIIDPALKDTTRNLMALRDEVVENGAAFVVAPCLHQKPCPMLKANDRDWCHFYIEWRRPKLIAAVDEATGLDHRYLKMGYLVLQAGAQRGMTNKKNHRVVSSPLCSKGKTELVLCGEDGELRRIRRLDRHASESNADFDRVKRGDILCINEAPTARVGACDVLHIVEPFNTAPPRAESRG